jgi:ribosomal protein S9
MKEKKKIIVVSGKRKTANAKAKIFGGSGKITINGENYENLGFFKKLRVKEPVDIAKEKLGKLTFDIEVKVSGGGKQGQNDASRLAITKAIVKFTNNLELKKIYSDYDKTLLVADTRRKEVCKPGDSKARRKRQKSFR